MNKNDPIFTHQISYFERENMGYILIRKLLKMIYSAKNNVYSMRYFDTIRITSYDDKIIFKIRFPESYFE